MKHRPIPACQACGGMPMPEFRFGGWRLTCPCCGNGVKFYDPSMTMASESWTRYNQICGRE